MRWDFAFSENSYGFHAPQEAARIIGQCQEFARKGQIELSNELAKFGVNIELTQTADEVPEPEQITSHKGLVATPPSQKLKELDERVKNLDFN